MKLSNKILSASIVIALFFVACVKEQTPAGLILQSDFVPIDSTYLGNSNVTPQLKNVLLEEFTGVQCANCPKGAADIKTIQKANVGRVLVVKIHNDFLAAPIKPIDPDFRIPEADALFTQLGAQVKPSAGVDRLYNTVNDPYTFSISSVASKVAQQLAKPTPINIDVVATKTTSGDSINIEAKFIFTDSTSKDFAYHMYVLENDVEATQDSLIYELDYIHEEILRKSITPTFVGTQIPQGYKDDGRVFLTRLRIAKPTKVININKCVIVVFISDKITNEIIQAKEVSIL